MKKYFYSLMVAMFTAFSFTLTACGGDGDGDEPDNSHNTNYTDDPNHYISEYTKLPGNAYRRVTFNYDGEYSETILFMEGGCYPYPWNADYNLDHGVRIVFIFGDERDWTSHHLSFNTNDAIEEGTKLKANVEGLYFSHGYDEYLSVAEVTGYVYVKAINGNNMTLEFKNFTIVGELNNGETQKTTINGSVIYHFLQK